MPEVTPTSHNTPPPPSAVAWSPPRPLWCRESGEPAVEPKEIAAGMVDAWNKSQAQAHSALELDATELRTKLEPAVRALAFALQTERECWHRWRLLRANPTRTPAAVYVSYSDFVERKLEDAGKFLQSERVHLEAIRDRAQSELVAALRPPKPEGDTASDQEIRAAIRTSRDPAEAARKALGEGDRRTLGAILSGPASTSGIGQAELDALRDAAALAFAPRQSATIRAIDHFDDELTRHGLRLVDRYGGDPGFRVEVQRIRAAVRADREQAGAA